MVKMGGRSRRVWGSVNTWRNRQRWSPTSTWKRNTKHQDLQPTICSQDCLHVWLEEGWKEKKLGEKSKPHSCPFKKKQINPTPGNLRLCQQDTRNTFGRKCRGKSWKQAQYPTFPSPSSRKEMSIIEAAEVGGDCTVAVLWPPQWDCYRMKNILASGCSFPPPPLGMFKGMLWITKHSLLFGGGGGTVDTLEAYLGWRKGARFFTLISQPNKPRLPCYYSPSS